MRAQHHRGNIRSTTGLQSVSDAWYNGLLHPCDIIVDSCHRLTQANQQSHIGIVFDESGDGLACIIGNQRCDGTMTVLCLQSIMVGKRFAQNDIIEHLNHPDATLVGFMGEE